MLLGLSSINMRAYAVDDSQQAQQLNQILAQEKQLQAEVASLKQQLNDIYYNVDTSGKGASVAQETQGSGQRDNVVTTQLTFYF